MPDMWAINAGGHCWFRRMVTNKKARLLPAGPDRLDG
jgi:hypothetical protein